MNTCRLCPWGLRAETLNMRFRVGDLGPLEKRKRYTSIREEGVGGQMCLCGKAIQSKTHLVGECEVCQEERNVSEDMTEIDECDMQGFGTLDSSDNTVAILGDIDGGHRRRHRKGVKLTKRFLVSMETNE